MGNFGSKRRQPAEQKQTEQHKSQQNHGQVLAADAADAMYSADLDRELIKFLATAAGATWLADVLLEFPGHVEKLRTASLTEVNQFVIAKYKEFTSSSIGSKWIWSPTNRKVVEQDTLMLPVYIVEDFVRQKLRANITRNWWSIGWFLATRTPFMCAAVYLAKHAVKEYILQPHAGGRCKRAVKIAMFVLDELLPTQFYGPLLTYGLLAHKMVRELDDS